MALVVCLRFHPASGLSPDDEFSQLIVDEYENPEWHRPDPPFEPMII